MKTVATARLSLMLGQPRSVAYGLMRLHAVRRQLLAQAGHEASRGKVVAAAALVIIWLICI